MAFRREWDQRATFVRLAVAAGSFMALRHIGPIFNDAGDFSFLTAGAGLALAVSGTLLVSEGFYRLGQFFRWRDAHAPRGNKGDGGFARSIRELRKDLIPFPMPGPYWGVLNGRAIFADFTMACVLGPTGSGKNIGHNDPNILSIEESKKILDLKGDTTPVYADALRKRGEEVRILNFGAMLTESLGDSDQYNPLNLIADCFFVGSIQDVTNELTEFSLIIYPEPRGESGSNDNRYFRDGSRTLIRFAICVVVLINGYNATLGDALALLQDRESLLWHAYWVAGRLEDETGGNVEFPIFESPWVTRQVSGDVERFADYLRGLAAGIADLLQADDSRTVDSFLQGALQAMEPYNCTTRAHTITKNSTFRFADMKEPGRTVTVFLLADATRLEANKPIIELVQHCAMTEWKRSPHKAKPVYFLANESANFLIHNLREILTFLRGYGVHVALYLQGLSAFVAAYSKETLDTVLSEQDAFLVLPGQTEPETLKLLESYLSQESYIERDHSGDGRGPSGLRGFGIREAGRPVMTAEAIRRSKHAILWLKKNRPALVSLPSIASIAPFRTQQAINPFYGKPYRLPVRLRLWRYMWPGKVLRPVFSILRALQFWIWS
ncbi:MAG: type IV secretory system conjugative DNA transfer family protein [Caulobacterales bacterium]|uniref:type IV secretory system conjugative DNA transfer family protein n=1 Tax=Glycocaulis sp. TaxID=1969725 RepID=UPI003F9ED351